MGGTRIRGRYIGQAVAVSRAPNMHEVGAACGLLADEKIIDWQACNFRIPRLGERLGCTVKQTKLRGFLEAQYLPGAAA